MKSDKEKEYQKQYQRKLYEKQRQEKTYCEICKCKLISHFIRKHARTKKHQLNTLKIENERLLELLNPLKIEINYDSLVDSANLEIVDVSVQPD